MVGAVGWGVSSSSQHDALVELFRDRPALAGELLGVLVPSVKWGARVLREAAVVSQSFEQIQPATYAADLVVTFGERAPRAVVIVEVQRRRSKEKRRSWPLYVAHLWARYGCPVFLLVLAPKARVAAWCAQPISLGHPGLALTPLVAGPESVPRIADAEEANRRPELAVLSAIVHAEAPDAFDLAVLAAEAILFHGPDSSYLYYDLIVSALREVDATRLDERMTQHREFASRSLRRAYSEGLVEGEGRGAKRGHAQGLADGLLQVLRARGIEVPAEVEERIRGCHDVALLGRWLERAATLSSIDELMD